jgi:pyridoxal phosphate enzyme (YggS family)
MSGIKDNITSLKKEIPANVKLVAVSKTRSVSDIMEAYNSGQRYFGENRVQEILNKKDLLPSDIEWHLIGHLQTNKVKAVVPFINMIQSVDSYKLLTVINSESQKINRVVDCLLQIHIAEEETKFGFSVNEVTDVLESGEFNSLKNVRICGLMGMATFTDNTIQVSKEFNYLADTFKSLKTRFFGNSPFFKEISMGMSGDYKLAINAGSTIVRIGSLIFGERIKNIQ